MKYSIVMRNTPKSARLAYTLHSHMYDLTLGKGGTEMFRLVVTFYFLVKNKVKKSIASKDPRAKLK